MQSKQIVLPEGMFSYYIEEKDKAGIVIKEYTGTAGIIVIPEKIEGLAVKEIGKKAFLGNHFITQVSIPDSIEKIGDWAFANCSVLQKVKMPKKEILFGRQIFAKSYALWEIEIADCPKSLARLLAVSVTLLEAEYLIQLTQAGSTKWYEGFDARMFTVMNEPEENALKDLVYCAEEEMCGKQTAWIHKQNLKKAKLALCRLLYDEKLTEEMRSYLEIYLCQRTKGCKEETAWEALIEEQREQKQYCDILLAIHALHEKNYEAALEDLAKNQIELKAYLLKRWQEMERSTDIWKTLEI